MPIKLGAKSLSQSNSVMLNIDIKKMNGENITSERVMGPLTPADMSEIWSSDIQASDTFAESMWAAPAN
jgi:hypothetical protein